MISTFPVDGAGHGHKTTAAAAETQRQESFDETLARLDAELEAMRKQSQREQEQERLAREAKRAKQKKMDALRLRIQTLQSRVNMGQEGAERELSALKGQLFMMMLFG